MDLLKSGGKSNTKGTLTPHAFLACRAIKDALCQQTVLHTPLPGYPYSLRTDTSNTGLRVVLVQEMLQGERPIYYLSCKLMATECKYAVIEKEGLAICWAIEQLKYYLWGPSFTVITDHAPLQWFA